MVTLINAICTNLACITWISDRARRAEFRETRNKLVAEGKEVPQSLYDAYKATTKIISRLVECPVICRTAQ